MVDGPTAGQMWLMNSQLGLTDHEAENRDQVRHKSTVLVRSTSYLQAEHSVKFVAYLKGRLQHRLCGLLTLLAMFDGLSFR